MEARKQDCLRLPMNDSHVRSLNLSNVANIVIYEALRQQNFGDLDATYHYRDTEKALELGW